MKKWIYIKSERLIDAYAVASLLATNPEGFAVVRRKKFAPLFRTFLPFIEYNYFPAGDTAELIIIEQNEASTVAESAKIIADQLGLVFSEEIAFSQDDLHNVLLNNGLCLMLTADDKEIPLPIIDFVINSVIQKGVEVICASESRLPCIRRCKDYRNIIRWEHIPLLANKNVALVTNNMDYVCLAKSYSMNVIYLSFENEILSANGYSVHHPEELLNIILKEI